jgi:hypothetical protein
MESARMAAADAEGRPLQQFARGAGVWWCLTVFGALLLLCATIIHHEQTFEPNDLYEARQLPQVARCVLALGRAAWELPGYAGPCPW